MQLTIINPIFYVNPIKHRLQCIAMTQKDFVYNNECTLCISSESGSHEVISVKINNMVHRLLIKINI